LPRVVKPIALLDKGIARNGFKVFKDGKEIGFVTSGTMVPYFKTEGHGLDTVIKEEKGTRAIGLALIDSNVIVDDQIEVEIRNNKVKAVVAPYHMKGDAPPFARPIIYGYTEEYKLETPTDYKAKALNLLEKSLSNHLWRQEECINLIPSEMSHSSAVRLLSITDPSFRYAEHKKVKSFYDYDVFYYQGTKFIDEVEHLLVEEMKKFLRCSEVETRVISGQMANTAVFSAIMDFKNRVNRKRDAQRLGYVLNNHIIKGGHLSSQPMGALHDYIAVDPVTEKPAVVNFPVLKDNSFKIDVEETKKIIEKYRPEFIIFGKSMVLHKEPVKEIRAFVDEQKIDTTIMYDMAHVLGLVGDYFQDPFAEGAEIVTGSTHKTFFGSQRGVIATNWKEDELKYKLWETIETRAFPGSVSNHHLGTMLALLMAAYEMNHFKDEYQKNVIENAKYFAKCLKDAGMEVAGDPAISYTETHQVIVKVGYGMGPEAANRLEANNIIVNYQATPDEEGFTASGALRIGVSEMTRFGFGKKEFEQLAELIADCLLRNKDVKEEVKKLRSNFTEMKYCFKDEEVVNALDKLARSIHL
jgi:aminomethyltransferase